METQDAQPNQAVSTRVVLVGGGPDVLAQAEPLLPRGAYSVEFVETYEAPYGAIRAARPDIVVLCLRIEDAEGFQLLSMLRLDPATRLIPVLTYTTRFEGQRFEGVDEGERPGIEAAARQSLLARH
jgi:CheY-like chemotaxis protein